MGRGGVGRGPTYFTSIHLLDMVSERNLSLDLQNSQLSLPNAVNLAVILHWLTFI